MMTKRSCPYPDCGYELNDIKPKALDFCDGCGGAVLLCPSPDCQYVNRIWAVYCRACGSTLLNKPEIIKRYQPRFLVEWEEPYGLFFSTMIEPNPDENWQGRLVGLQGSILVFSHKTDAGYSKLYLIHPYFKSQAEPIELHRLIHNPDSEVDLSFSGAAALTDQYLFLGSNKFLYQIDLPSLSTADPYRLDLHLQVHQIGADEITPFSPDLLLLRNHSSLYLWDGENKQKVAQLEVQSKYYSIDGDKLFLAGSDHISVFQIDTKNKQFIFRKSANPGPWRPSSEPCFIEGKLYLLATSLKDGQKAILKWENMDKEGIPLIDDKPRLILRDENLIGLKRAENSYLVLSCNRVSGMSAFSDQENYRLSQDILVYPSVDPGIFGSIIALPVKNPFNPSLSYVSVVDGQSGKYIMTTEPFGKICSAPVLWGRYLFILGQRDKETPVGIYGFDLAGRRKPMPGEGSQ